MSKAKWSAFPYPAKDYLYAGDALKKNWAALHEGDCEPYPKEEGAREAWRQFHQGKFAEAVRTGREAGGSGVIAAIKAQVTYASSVEKKEATRVALLEEAMREAEDLVRAEPRNANAHYFYAFAAGRYSQRISVMKALSQGYGGKIRLALDTALKLSPRHADAHIALGTWHAEILDKVGAMVGGLTYGAKKEAAEEHFRKALKLAPHAPIASIEYANALVMIHGKKMVAEAGRLYAAAAALRPRDAMERLDVEMAKSEIA